MSLDAKFLVINRMIALEGLRVMLMLQHGLKKIIGIRRLVKRVCGKYESRNYKIYYRK